MDLQSRSPVPRELQNLDPIAGQEGRFTGLQLHFIRRLSRLVQLRQQQAGHLNPEGLKLLDRVIFSVYCDCLDQGVGDVAQAIIHQMTSSAAGNDT